MRVLRVFFLGLLYGWFMKWIIDEIFTKEHLRMIANENTLLRERIRDFESLQSQEMLTVQRPMPVSGREATALPGPALARSAEEAILTAEQPPALSAREETAVPASEPQRVRSAKDDLKLIKGIGPQLEKKLNNAGITTFEQMSRLTSAELQSILGISKRAVQNSDNLLSQARKFAQETSNR